MNRREPRDSQPDVEELHTYLRALSSPTRLRLLWQLRTPKRAGDVRVAASEGRGGLSEDRILSRPAVAQHLEVLSEVGLVERREGGDGVRHVVNHQILFHILQALGRLAEVRPVVDVDVGETLEAGRGRLPPLPKGPKLVATAGPRMGAAFPLEGPGPWTVGRKRSAEVCLEWDPHVSRTQGIISRDPDGAFLIEALPSASNPLQLDFQNIPPGEVWHLLSGGILSAGASVLVFQIL